MYLFIAVNDLYNIKNEYVNILCFTINVVIID